MKKRMNPNHPEWKEFIHAVLQPNFSDRLPGPVDLNCDHTTHRITRMILETFPDVDIKLSLKYLKKKGGRCDCEVAQNIAAKHADPEAMIKAKLIGVFQEACGYWYEQGRPMTEVKEWIQRLSDRFVEVFTQPSIV